AHAIEDLLDAMRQGDVEVTPERMDHVFAGIDEIEACLDEIEADGQVSRTVRPTIDDLRGVLEAAGDESAAASPPANDSGAGNERSAPDHDFDVDALRGIDDPVYHVEVDMGESEMPGVDAMFALEDIEDAYDVIDASPDREALEDGEYDRTFELAVATHEADVDEGIASIGRVASATATELDLTPMAPDTSGEQTERSKTGDDAASDESGAAGDTGDAESAGPSVGEIQSVRVDVDRLDDLHGLVEQLVTTRIKLRRGIDVSDRRAEEELDELDKITSNLQDTVMDMRLVPMKKIVGKFPRLVRDLAREQGKQVDFEIDGDDVELDRTILTEISDPLMHLLRNAVDHGIEVPEEREAAGKDPTGTITLSAERERDRVMITVRDDGRGIDRESVREKAVEKGVFSREEVTELSDSAVAELIFHPGFSTNEEVTDVSGRGVGMDVVKDTVSRLDGSVSVESEKGEGTTITLTLPVTVAIVKVLFVEVGEEEYGIPIKAVDEIGRMRPVKTVDGESVVTYDDEVYPLVRLDEALSVPGTVNGDGMLVRIRESERKVTLRCEEVRGQEEVVVKPFEGILSGIPGLSGAAVLGEGDVVPILDVGTL
ncbi:MAG: ATP-binding protein, partial [Halanaeroarchaeum sp.]